VTAGIVLAAGLSRRMGQAKLMLDWEGAPVIRRTVERVLAAGLDDVVVVTGPEAGVITEALAGLRLRFAVNPVPEAGQAGSVVAGIRALQPGTTTAVIALGDQPTLPEDIIPRLVAVAAETGKAIVAPSYRGARGNPVLFAASVFPELLALTGDEGARGVIVRDPARVALAHFDLPMPPDLDTPDDYERLRPGPRPV
jgi:molybdenum cofactor cytidylyltransferase